MFENSSSSSADHVHSRTLVVVVGGGEGGTGEEEEEEILARTACSFVVQQNSDLRFVGSPKVSTGTSYCNKMFFTVIVFVRAAV